jgi:hypothetical protein
MTDYTVCDYEYSEDYYSEGHTCKLQRGHAGQHMTVIRWPSRPDDVCREKGHRWGVWGPFNPDPYLLLARGWKVNPEKMRGCRRCGAKDYKGGERDQDISDLLVASLLAPLARVLIGKGETEVHQPAQ